MWHSPFTFCNNPDSDLIYQAIYTNCVLFLLSHFTTSHNIIVSCSLHKDIAHSEWKVIAWFSSSKLSPKPGLKLFFQNSVTINNKLSLCSFVTSFLFFKSLNFYLEYKSISYNVCVWSKHTFKIELSYFHYLTIWSKMSCKICFEEIP